MIIGSMTGILMTECKRASGR